MQLNALKFAKHSRRFSWHPALVAASLSLSLPIQVAVSQTVVSAGGAGSFASSVPAADQNTDAYYALPASQVTGTGSFYDLLKVAPALASKPMPTNHWWTDLLVGNRSSQQTDASGATTYTLSQGKITDTLSGLYGGRMWFYPGMLVPRSYGFDLYYPNSWQNNPTSAAVDPGPALQVHGDRPYSVPPEDILVADFESSYPTGWTITSFAGYTNPFGPVPAQASWGHTLTGAIGNGRVDSTVKGPGQSSNAYRGMISGSFTVQKNYLHLLVGGGSDAANLYVRLLVGGNVVYTAAGSQSTKLSWQSWDISPYLGQTATLEIVDNSSASYGFIACDQIVQSNATDPTTRYGTDLTAQGDTVTNWGDWNVDFELADAAGLAIDVTMVRGVPFTWSTWKGGLKPKITGLSGVQFLDASGSVIGATGGSSFVASAFAFSYQGRAFGVFLPDNTTVTVGTDFIEPQFSGSNNYLVVGYLPATSNLAEFTAVAYARPTDTKLSWTYAPATGSVSTNWNISTSPLKGSNLNTIQGWLPHHYRTTTNNLAFGSYSYLTAIGTMKCATGNNFTINFPFRGIVPTLPAPVATGAANDYQPARMQTYLSGFNPGNMLGETYGSGKALGLCAQLMAQAAQSGDTADFNRLKTALETSLANWFTYTPGEETGTAGYFARYADWKALIGFDASYGSQAFNDLHFHYGYFTSATGLVGMYDPQFLVNYGPMIRAIAKTYANYDRDDTSQPFLRTFDVWEGHSNAGGLSSSGGENQESSSEAVQSWAGLFFLGNALNDPQMVAAAAMGFSMESAATNEYWQDVYGTNRPSTFTKGIAGMVWSGHTDYATYFSADPAWVYGIQYVPSNHYLNYLTRYQTPTQIAAKYNTMWTERENWANSYPLWDTNTVYTQQWVRYNSQLFSPKNSAAIPAGQVPSQANSAYWDYQADYGRTEPDILGAGLSPYVLTYQALFDPDTAAAEFDRYYAAKEQIVQGGTGATDYYQIHAMRQLGKQDFNSYISIPTSAVYYNANTDRWSYVVYNGQTTQQNATVYRNGTAVGTFPVPAQTTVTSHLDQTLTNLVLTPAVANPVVPPGQTLQFDLTGYDQYGATYPLSGVSWTVSGGGTINTAGLFSATTNAYPVTVTASVNGAARTYAFRVGPVATLSILNITPGFTRVITGTTQSYSVTGTDQYGNPWPLGTVGWTVSGNTGSISADGVYTASSVGVGTITASSASVSSSVLVAAHAPLANVALGCSATASTTIGATNVARNVTDGNTTTRWESTHNVDNQSIYVDLGKVYDLASVNIIWEAAYAKTYDVEVATDLTLAQPWTVVATPPVKTSSTADNLSLANATGRYLKLNLLTRPTNSTNGFSIYEIQIYGYLNAAAITPTTVQVSPGNPSVIVGGRLPFQAYTFDANAEGGPAVATWALSGSGNSITVNGGLFSANTVGGPFTVTGKISSITGSTTVKVVSGQSAYGAWQSQYFTPAELSDSTVVGPNSAPAGDGITNLLKYALGLPPKTNGTGGLPVVSTMTISGKAYLTLTYTRLLAATDVTAAVEVSSDFALWSSGTNSTATASTTNNPDGKTQTVLVRDLTALSTSTQKRFIRLKVSAP